MAKRDIVVVGASAGGVSALIDLARELSGFTGSILAVVHMSMASPGVLPSLVASASGLAASFPKNGAVIEAGHIYIGRPDYHLLIKEGRIELSHGPKENGFRPAADPLFRTAARCFGRRVVGVVLSGGLDDGTDGLRVIQKLGGIAIAQDPEEAVFPSMPASAIRSVKIDHVARVAEIATLLRGYAREDVAEDESMGADLDERPDIAENGDKAIRNGAALGPPSVMTCPDCGGSLWEFCANNQLRYRCHVGHSYTGDGLVQLKDEHLEQALWTAVRSMEEAAALRMRMADLAERGRWESFAPPYRGQAEDLRNRADLIRAVLAEGVERKAGQNGVNGAAGRKKPRVQKRAVKKALPRKRGGRKRG